MPFNSKLAVPVALGLSLVTVSAFLVYYVFVKKDEEREGRSIKTSRVQVIEVTVPKSIVPALIGRSGSNIKEIERKTGALIHFKKFSDKDHDVCIIRGRKEAAQLAETLVHDFMRQQPVIVEDSMFVPGWACGRIIGTGGENINEISHRSGARVKIEGIGAKDNTQRVIQLKGTKEQLQVARKLIDNCVAQEKCRREIEQSRRSPRHASQPQSPQPPQSPVDPKSPVDPQSPVDPKSPPAPEAPDADAGDVNTPGDRRTKYRKSETTGAAIEVYVSAVSSPARFWVQLVGAQVAQLDELVQAMTDYYGNRDNRENHALKSVSVGQVVAAVFRHDGRWYRARVQDIRPNEFDASKQVADVFFVDYGDSEYVATHELCELRADLLRLRFQAMECFLAGVKPAGSEEETVGVTSSGQRWPRWHPQAIERFEELTQVARWKPLVSRTCTYKKTPTGEGDKEKEIPGIKLFDVTEEGELDIGAALIEEGWAVPAALCSPRASPPRPAPTTPFGDLGNSKILNMLDGNTRASSVSKDNKYDHDTNGLNGAASPHTTPNKENSAMTTSKSLGSGLEHGAGAPKSVSNFSLAYPEPTNSVQVNGSHSHDFLNSERQNAETEGSETLRASPIPKEIRNEMKANMNRIDSHHNLETMANDLHKAA